MNRDQRPYKRKSVSLTGMCHMIGLSDLHVNVTVSLGECVISGIGGSILGGF